MTARFTLGYYIVGEPDVDAAEECPDCGFDALLAFPLTLLTADGVTPFGRLRMCVRCYEEEDRADS